MGLFRWTLVDRSRTGLYGHLSYLFIHELYQTLTDLMDEIIQGTDLEVQLNNWI